jgi:cell division protein FtsQ
VKRPEGFDPVRPAAPSEPTRSKPARATPVQAKPASGELRAAARDRRRYEKREIRRFTRRTRHRRLGWLVALGLVAGLGGLLAAAVYSPLLSLRTITIEGTSTVSPDAVRDAIDDQLGTPLALLDYDRIRNGLDAFPLIRSFVTEIVPPSTLVVHIVERAPIGTIVTSSGFAVVDPAGVVLSTTPTRTAGVPLIQLAEGGTDSVSFRAVVDVLLALPESIRSKVDIASASSKDDVRLVLSGVGQRVVWGSAERSALKARVLEELMAARGSDARLEYDVSAPLSPVVRAG